MRLGRIQNDYSAKGFDIVKESGLSFIEICCNNGEEAERLCKNKEEIKKQIERTSIDVSSIGRWNHDILSKGEINKEKEQNYFALLDAAIEIGAKTFVCGCNFDESVSYYKNYTLAIAFFKSLIERAEGKIKIAVQNCDWNNFVTSEKQWEVILGELPDLYIKYDASHAYNRNEDYLKQMADWGHRFAHVHIKGTCHANGKDWVDDPPAGMDDLKWGSIFAVLYSRGYNGDLSIEPHSRTWHGELGAFGVSFTKDYISKFIRF